MEISLKYLKLFIVNKNVPVPLVISARTLSSSKLLSSPEKLIFTAPVLLLTIVLIADPTKMESARKSFMFWVLCFQKFISTLEKGDEWQGIVLWRCALAANALNRRGAIAQGSQAAPPWEIAIARRQCFSDDVNCVLDASTGGITKTNEMETSLHLRKYASVL